MGPYSLKAPWSIFLQNLLTHWHAMWILKHHPTFSTTSPPRGKVFVPSSWIWALSLLVQWTMAEMLLCWLRDPNLEKLASFTSCFLVVITLRIQPPCCKEAQATPWRGTDNQEPLSDCAWFHMGPMCGAKNEPAQPSPTAVTDPWRDKWLILFQATKSYRWLVMEQ